MLPTESVVAVNLVYVMVAIEDMQREDIGICLGFHIFVSLLKANRMPEFVTSDNLLGAVTDIDLQELSNQTS